MTSRQHGIAGAIERSVSHDEIVIVQVAEIESAYLDLCAQRACDEWDHVDTRDNDDLPMREVWGTTDDGDTWRVHLVVSGQIK